jgi:hypothetical protein
VFILMTLKLHIRDHFQLFISQRASPRTRHDEGLWNAVVASRCIRALRAADWRLEFFRHPADQTKLMKNSPIDASHDEVPVVQYAKDHFLASLIAQARPGDQDLLAEVEYFVSLPEELLNALDSVSLGLAIVTWAEVRLRRTV